MENAAPTSRGYFLGDYQGLAAAGTSFYALFAQAGSSAANPSDIWFRDPPPAADLEAVWSAAAAQLGDLNAPIIPLAGIGETTAAAGHATAAIDWAAAAAIWDTMDHPVGSLHSTMMPRDAAVGDRVGDLSLNAAAPDGGMDA